MSKLHIEMCPETGICSILKPDGAKIDLMPDEATAVQDASGKPEEIKKLLAEVDPNFADSLDKDDLARLARGLT